MVERARALGWPADAVDVIDEDLGRSGATADDRNGFRRLPEAVGHGKAGAIFTLEVSRLARSSQDWQRLLALCGVAQVVVCDEHAIYDPREANDKLLLDFKGTMSEAELDALRARLRGGILNKARRGELRSHLPAGLIHDPAGCVVLDSDQQVQETVRLLFQTFTRTGSLRGTIKYFRQQGLLFPKRTAGPQKGQLVWVPLSVGRSSLQCHAQPLLCRRLRFRARALP